MARYVFFSFAYDDVKNFKVNVVRNSWFRKNPEDSFIDGSIWEKSKSKSDSYLKRLIENGLTQTSVTTVLIGENTANRRWINYEIIKSFEKGNGILAIHINRIKSRLGYICARGQNPLDRLAFEVSENGKKINFYELYDNSWYVYEDLPQINNRKSNTLVFEDSFWRGNEFGKFYRFSEKFSSYCWVTNDGHGNFPDWIEDAAEQAGR